ncbi:MAG: ribosome recycling factor [Alphaproteobacteria bacterium]
MHGAVEVFKQELAGLRTGRASAALLEPIIVEAYGGQMPVSQIGTVSVIDSRMLSVQVWDRGLVGATERAIRDGGLGLNPSAEGQVIRVPLPELNQERRTELTKVAHKYAEQTRVAVRNVRRDAMDVLKHQEKDGDISQDEQRALGQEVQKLTDETIKEIDEILASKEAEIMQV